MDKLNNEIKKCLCCKKPLCVRGCPLNTNIPSIIELLKKNNIDEAINLQYQYNSISFICGKLCDHTRQCVGNCNLKNNPVKISDICFELGLKRIERPISKKKSIGKSVAIIGGGPAGMICSELLLEEGFDVYIYEKSDRLGGVLSHTMPNFRFDNSILQKWINRLINLGLNVKYHQDLGKNLTFKDLSIFDYIVIATGASNSRRLFNNELTLDALDVLNEYKNNNCLICNKKVIILGGGNTAYDVARVMKRLGNEVSIAYRRDLTNSPASIVEINCAKEEGIKIYECLNPKEILKNNNQVIGIKFNKTILVNNGGPRLNFSTTDEIVTIDCDIVIEAIGASTDLSIIKDYNPELLDDNGYAKSIINHNLYIIGDAYLGPSSFVKTNYTARICAEDIIKKESNR